MSIFEMQRDRIPQYTATQLAGANRAYGFDVGALATTSWQPNMAVQPGSVLRPTPRNQTGFVYQNGASLGQTGAKEPAWATAQGGITIDGSLELTAVIPPAGDEDTIQSVTWTQIDPPDSALLITSEVNTSFVAAAHLGGGTSGNVYTVQADITMVSGAVYPAQVILTTI